MADFKMQRDTNRFFTLGMDLNRPVDDLKQLKYTFLKNVRSYQTGRMEPRQGLTLIDSVTGSVHSIRRLNAPRTSTWTRVIGSGTILSTGTTSFTQVDSGYSGDPLALAPYRPSQSPDPWMYVMDSLKQRKISVDGTVHYVGLPPPTLPPIVTRNGINYKTIFDANISDTGWSGGPTFVGGLTPESPTTIVSTTATDIIYDTGTTGWCVIQPGVINGFVSNMLVSLGGTEDVIVQSVSTGSTTSDTIESISPIVAGDQYSVVLTSQKNNLTINGVLENTTRSSSARVESVINGISGDQALVISDATGWAAGDTVYLRSSIRCYTSLAHSEGETLITKAIEGGTNITEDYSLPFTGYVCSPKFSPALDLSKITDDISSTPDSYIAINLSLTRPNDATQIQIKFGCLDVSGDHDNFFTTDYFYATRTPSDLDSSTGLKIKLAEFEEVGSPSWKNIYYFQVEVTIRPPLNDEERSSIYNLYTHYPFHSIYLGGESGPDSGTVGSGYLYRYRARSSSTGVVSNWSPATLEAYILTGEAVTLTAPSQYTLAAEADKLDFQRRGGSLPDTWYYVGSVQNSSPPTPFTDEYPDDVIVANPSDDQTNYQLWPTIGSPASGSGASISGVMVTGTGFSTTWAPNTPILIAGSWYTIYQVYSTTSLQLFESGGTQTNVSWEVPEPILQGQPLPCFWGPLDDTFFACGDPINPQRLYWTNRGDADSAALSNWKDITTPSEPLMNGVVYNGRAYVWSSERFFQIIQDSTGAWTYVEIPSGKGLWARWAFTSPQSVPGSVLFFLSKDGIYVTDGGTPSDITAEDLRPLFPNEGNLGMDVNGVPYPYMISGAASYFRLSYYDDYLYFTYPTSGTAVPLTASFSDDLNLWADLIRDRNYQLIFVDSFNLWGDALALEGPSVPFDIQDDMNLWADDIGVTLT